MWIPTALIAIYAVRPPPAFSDAMKMADTALYFINLRRRTKGNWRRRQKKAALWKPSVKMDHLHLRQRNRILLYDGPEGMGSTSLGNRRS